MKRYGFTIVLMVVIFCAVVAGERWTAVWIGKAESRVSEEDMKNKQASLREAALTRGVKEAAEPRRMMQQFIRDWEPFVKPFAKDADFLASMMALLDEEAQRNTVATSGKTTPARQQYRIAGRVVEVQPISITVSGDLRSCLNWLGTVEFRLPYMRVEGFEISGFGRSSTAMRISVVHPVPPAVPAPAARPTTP